LRDVERISMKESPAQAEEPHDDRAARRANWLRAGVLGADDGIVSVAALLLGVAGATGERAVMLAAGVSGLVAGALSMGIGEYVSVSTQRDTERALLDLERRELEEDPKGELRELTWLYADKGLPLDLAAEVAVELTRHDALRSHADAELNIDPDELVDPWAAAAASAGSFALGALLPLVAIVVSPAWLRVPLTVVAVLLALAATGFASARLGRAGARRATLRVILGGALAMAVTYGIGLAVGTAI
jgi:VIT1/CCC1 family predicted Fe2+/Mn2+ transporter